MRFLLIVKYASKSFPS